MLHIKLKVMEHRAPFMYKVCSYTHPQPPDGVKHIIFLKVFTLHIKFKEMEYRAPRKHKFCSYTHPRPMGLGQNIFLKYQIKGNGA